MNLISSMLPTQNSMYLKSVYRLRKLFESLFPHIGSNCHRYCTICHTLLTSDVCCHGDKNVGWFVTASIEAQLKAKFKGMLRLNARLSLCMYTLYLLCDSVCVTIIIY